MVVFRTPWDIVRYEIPAILGGEGGVQGRVREDVYRSAREGVRRRGAARGGAGLGVVGLVGEVLEHDCELFIARPGPGMRCGGVHVVPWQ